MSAFTADNAALTVNYSVDVTTLGIAATSWVTVLPSGLGMQLVSTGD